MLKLFRVGKLLLLVGRFVRVTEWGRTEYTGHFIVRGWGFAWMRVSH